MKYFWLISLAAVSLAGGLGPSQANEPRFFEVLYDIPVMPGLQELPGQSLVFDKPSGRIAQAAALAPKAAPSAIWAFYNQTLPQMGWKKTGEGTYIRGDEALRLTIENSGDSAPDGSVVRFVLTPR